MKYIFDARGCHSPSYLDVGAYDPFHFSNTALFYQLGSRGVNVEANPHKIGLFKSLRPRDQTVWAAVVAQPGPLSLFVPDESDTLASVQSSEDLKGTGKPGQRYEVPGVTVAQLLEAYCNGHFPDFLTVDTEGLELAILEQIPFAQTKPKVICVETVSYSATGHGVKDGSIAPMLENHNYLQYADTNINSVFVAKDFWYLE